jgi:FMN phosphatase YigB (HAD superfamily)
MPCGITTLVFDVDGTLYRQRPVRMRMFARLLRSALIRPTETASVVRALRAYRQAQERLRDLCPDCESLAEEQIRAACRATGLPEPAMASYVAKWMEESPLDLLRPALRDGVVDLLAGCKRRGLRLAVWSDYPAAAKLKAMGLAGFFDVGICAQDAEVRRFKPDPRGLEVIMSRLGVSKDEVLYIGDRPEVDGVAAARAGVRCLIVGKSTTSSFREVLANLTDRDGIVGV